MNIPKLILMPVLVQIVVLISVPGCAEVSPGGKAEHIWRAGHNPGEGLVLVLVILLVSVLASFSKLNFY